MRKLMTTGDLGSLLAGAVVWFVLFVLIGVGIWRPGAARHRRRRTVDRQAGAAWPPGLGRADSASR